MTEVKIAFDPDKLKLVDPKTLKKDPKNRNKHSTEQIERMCKLFKKFGMRWPILVSEQTGFIKAGEGRLEAALKLKMPKVLVSYQEFEDAETEFAFGVSDNAIALWAELDLQGSWRT
jgi:ParB-like chromosome segregation protein Spo0J